MKINLQKSEIPIIWLDTFFVIECGKIALGTRDDKRYQMLYDIILEKTHKGKLLCARAEQEDELEDNVDISMKKFLSLTRGVEFDLGAEVCKRQSNRMIEVYHNKQNEFDILQSDACELPKCTNEPFTINIYSISNEKTLEIRNKEKQLNIRELQDFKNAQSFGVGFEKLLKNEYNGIYIATNNIITKAITLKKMFDGEIEFDMKLYNQFTGLVCEPLEKWYTVTGKKVDIAGYLEFLLSEEHKMIPHIDISSHLVADIIASPKNWGSGDIKDINNLSSVLPYCNFILTDKAQHNRLKRYDLDKKYDVDVFWMGNIDELIEIVNLL